mmetsp:Transcript_9030/g.20074  ORF Transcript_9030/g.20074 Transcript_9030/m.20074 type:complete len:262 (-) Transcript_9030:13-798(-)
MGTSQREVQAESPLPFKGSLAGPHCSVVTEKIGLTFRSAHVLQHLQCGVPKAGGATCRDGRSVRLGVGSYALPSGCLQQLPRHLRLLTQLTRGDGSAQNHRVALNLGFLQLAQILQRRLPGGQGIAGVNGLTVGPGIHLHLFLSHALQQHGSHREIVHLAAGGHHIVVGIGIRIDAPQAHVLQKSQRLLPEACILKACKYRATVNAIQPASRGGPQLLHDSTGLLMLGCLVTSHSRKSASAGKRIHGPEAHLQEQRAALLP